MREFFPASTHTTCSFLCIAPELGCSIYHIIFTDLLKKWPTLCKRENIISKRRAFFTIHLSIWWLCTNYNKIIFHGIPSLPMRFSLLHMNIINKMSLHHPILQNPFLHCFLLFLHPLSLTFLHPMMTLPHHHPLTFLHLMMILLHHLPITLHPHLMTLEHPAVKRAVRQMTLR